MSIDLMNRIWWRQDLRSTEKFVALALADWAGDDAYTCYPAIGTVALKCGLSDRAVQNSIRDLIGKGLLKKLPRPNQTHIFMFVIDALPHCERPKNRKAVNPLQSQDLTGEPDAPDFFDTGERGSFSGERGSSSGAADAPRLTIDTSEETPVRESGSKTLPAVVSKEPCDQEIVDSVCERWNEAAEKHPGVQKARLPLDAARAATIVRRSRRTADGEDVFDLWNRFFEAINASEFLQGRAPPGRGRSEPFKLSLGWALKSANFNEIMEGKYGRNANDSGHTSGGRRMGPAEQATARALERLLPADKRCG